MKVPVYRTQLVRESSAKYSFEKVKSPMSAKRVATELLTPFLANCPVEQFWVFTFDTKLKLTGLHPITTGTLDHVIVHPREVFKAAFLDSAYGLMTIHNHPSGEVTPSQSDFRLFQQLDQAAELLGFKVLDHLILGWDDEEKASAYSYREV